MAQLAALQSLSFARCIGKQPFSSALARFKTPAVSLRLHAIIAEVAEELTPKQRHHLRKKEAQKKLRKIRKERKARRHAEELAKIPVEKPDYALLRFERPVQNWNKPWRQKKARKQTLRSFHGVEFDDYETRASRGNPSLEDTVQGTNTSRLTSWSEFETAYQQKMMKTGYNVSSRRNGGHVKGVGTRSYRTSKVEIGTRSRNRRPLPTPPRLSNCIEEKPGSSREAIHNVYGRDGGRGLEERQSSKSYNSAYDLEEFAEDSKSGTSVKEKVKTLAIKEVNLQEETYMERSKWAVERGDKPQRKVEGKVTVEAGQFAGTSDKGPVARKDTRGIEEVKNEEEKIQPSEFWERRDMHLDERFGGESLRKKFESSGAKRKLSREERLGERKAFGKEIAKVLIGRRKGENVYFSLNDLEAVHPQEHARSELDEKKQLEWLAQQLHNVARLDGVHFSKLIRSGGLKVTDGRAVTLVKRLGELGNWRCAMQVVEWLNSRNHFPAVKSRYVFTTLLDVLGKARRPIESLNVFNVMREHVGTYPDMPAYRIVAVTLGQAGHMEELFELIVDLQRGPDPDTQYLIMLENNGCLVPDVVVYNAALNSCVPHRQWRCALWVLDQLDKGKHLGPNSASYGLAIEVLVKSGKFDLAWETFGKMELGGFYPNSLTYKILVEGLGRLGKVDVAVQMVKEMEQRGMVPVPSVYYALAYALCMSGRWKDALVEVDRISKLSKRPVVDTYTGIIMACKNAGLWQDAVSIFEHMQEVCAPNIGTYNIMISLYGRNEMYETAKKLFEKIKTGRISPRRLYRADPRLSPDVFTYDAMLGACTVSREWDDLEVLYRQMLLQGFQLNSKRHLWIVQSIFQAGKDKLLTAMFNHLRSIKDVNSELYVLIINSCLNGGEVENAFNHLQEMVDQDINISTIDLRRLQDMAFLLSEEDQLIFTSKVEVLKVTSEFNFKQLGNLSTLRKRNAIRKLPKKQDTLLSAVFRGRWGMHSGEHSQENLIEDSSSNPGSNGIHEISVDFEVDHEALQRLQEDQGSSSVEVNELLLEKLNLVQQTSNEFS